MSKKINYVAKTLEGKVISIEDEFIKNAYYPFDSALEIKAEWSTYGDVIKWMCAYRGREEEIGTITKDNFMTYRKGCFFDWKNDYVKGGGEWLMTMGGTNEKFDPITHETISPETEFIDIIAKGCKHNWDKKVRVISFYTGMQGLITIYVFDEEKKELMFTLVCLELFNNYRAR